MEQSMDTIFSLSSLTSIPFWLLMIFAPRWTWTRKIIGSPFLILPAAILYIVLVFPNIASSFPTLANPKLETIQTLLGSSAGATITWVHFLAFDLFVGRWAYLDSLERNIHPLLMAPILFLILMFGPLGFVLYLGARSLVSLPTKQLISSQ
jgi:Domain of unknown function (DUF4281)